MFKKILILLFNLLILALNTISLFCIKTHNIGSIIKLIIFCLAIILFALSYLIKWFKFQKTSKLFYILFILSSIASIIYMIFNSIGILDTLSSVTSLKNYILSTKEKGVFIYILIQCLQVIFLPIPAAIICVVGTIIYGPLLSGLYCTIGILIGSYISYLIGRTFGYKIVSWIVGADNTEKYSEIILKRGGFFLSIAFLLPMFPDDILCFIAGVTKMKFNTFFWITLITRPIGVICMSYFSSGSIIPFKGWGIYAWAIILIMGIIISLLIYKYQDKMQTFILNKVFKKRNKVN